MTSPQKLFSVNYSSFWLFWLDIFCKVLNKPRESSLNAFRQLGKVFAEPEFCVCKRFFDNRLFNSNGNFMISDILFDAALNQNRKAQAQFSRRRFVSVTLASRQFKRNYIFLWTIFRINRFLCAINNFAKSRSVRYSGIASRLRV